MNTKVDKEDTVGQTLCRFLTWTLGEKYSGLKGKSRLLFFIRPDWDQAYSKTGWDYTYSDREVRDSRLCHNQKVSVCWAFQYQILSRDAGEERKIQNASWRYLGKVLTDILCGRFSDILYLEEVEKRIISWETSDSWHRDGGAEALADPCVRYFLEEVLEDKKLREHYATVVMNKCCFPKSKLIIHISAQLYERRTVKTRLYFLNEDADEEMPDLRLNTGEGETLLSMENLRTIRKLMEASGESQGLLVRRRGIDYSIEGIVSYKEQLNSYIHFDGFLNWIAVYEGINVLEYHNGSMGIPMADRDENKDGWLMGLERLTVKANMEVIRKTVGSLIESQLHGTAIVFMNDELLETEAERLCEYRRAYRVEKPFLIAGMGEALKGILSIDGALLADLKGYCHAVGAIVDGELVCPGEPSRGARYNSIGNYIHWLMRRRGDEEKEWETGKEKICFAIILSEDGMVNLQVAE